jgi:hypothetical protein
MKRLQLGLGLMKHAISQWPEKFWMRLALLLPKPLVMWAAVRLMAIATQGEWSGQVVPELTAIDALKRWA